MKRKNILVIGGAGSLTDQLIRQFSKEGHRVSLLTGAVPGARSYPRVFERYDFSYTSEVLPEVFASVSPDVTVFAGACDAAFTWEDERRDAVDFVSAVMNVLSALIGQKKGRFVYLSDGGVFRDDGSVLHGEDDAPSADTPRGLALAQAEDLCRRMTAGSGIDLIIARLSGCYHLPKSPEDVNDALTEYCIKYLRDGGTPAADNRRLMPLAESDAVFFLTRLALAPAHAHTCYQIASGRELRCSELRQMVAREAEKLGYTVPADGSGGKNAGRKSLRTDPERRMADRTAGTGAKSAGGAGITFAHLRRPQAMLDNQRFREEFGINRLSDFEGDVAALVAHVLKNRESFLAAAGGKPGLAAFLRKELGWLGGVLLPIVENVVCFLVACVLTRVAGGGKYFARIDFYLLYVLLFAILYGQHHAILSAFLSTAGFLLMQLRASSAQGLLLDYGTYVWVAQLFILGLAVGYLRDRLSDQKNEALQDHEHMTKQIRDVREINESNVRVKDSLQTQIVNQNDSIGKIYEITSTLDKTNSEDVLFQAMDILRQIMGSEDVALYTVSRSEYARLFSATTEKAASLGSSIRFRDLGELSEALLDGRPYINRSLREDLPMMACAIHEGEEIRTLIMIWQLPWEKMTLGQASILTVTSLLIQNAVLRANRYLDALESQRFVEDTRILRQEAFVSILEAYRNAAGRGLTAFTLLRLPDGSPDRQAEEGRRASSCLRINDYLGQGPDGKLYALLPNTSGKNARFVLERLNSAGIRGEILSSSKTEVTA